MKRFSSRAALAALALAVASAPASCVLFMSGPSDSVMRVVFEGGAGTAGGA